MEMAMEDEEMEMVEGDKMMPAEDEVNDLRMANLAFLMVAGHITATAVIDLFFWKWQITYLGTKSDATTEQQEHHFTTEYACTNAGDFSRGWWKLGSLIGDWAMLGIYGTAFLTQLLSMFGIAAAINMMVWGYGVMLVGNIGTMIVTTLWMLGYREAMKLQTTDSDANGATTATQSAAGGRGSSLQKAIEKDMLKMMVKETADKLTLWEHHEQWMKAQFYALTAEEQELWMEEMDEKKGEWSDDWSDKEEHHDMDHEDMEEMSEETAPEEESAAEEEEEETSPPDFFSLYRKNVFKF